jgi:triosephosphate isomerase
LGHSERRTIFQETDRFINSKVQYALKSGLTPIFCIGERLEEREAGKLEEVLTRQLNYGLEGIDDKSLEKLIIAYEPVWAIGTGKTATPGDAQDAHAFIRNKIKSMSTPEVADGMRILYGGSVKPGNVTELIGQADIDGALVGGASIKVESWVGIVEGIDQAT